MPNLSDEAFFKLYNGDAILTQHKYGVPASVTLAQAALESGYGQHAPGFNFFGVKAGKSWNGDTQRLKTWESGKDGSKVTIFALFRKYNSANESFIDHAETILHSKYLRVAMDHTGSAEEFIHALAPHYATDPNYEQKVLEIINRFQLKQYDLK